MDDHPISVKQLTSATKQLARRLLPIGVNRMELLLLELQEARVRFLQLILLVCGIALCVLLGTITLTALVVALFWAVAPITVLIAVSMIYLGVGVLLWRRLAVATANLKAFNATCGQLRKDRAAFANFVS